ncbi:hypothetical protein CCR75_008632 [Bremia lactucae]|uniref:Uncharacterized protein n=1 Tax=Bremia lactucae TaxID=4779 RepID=A0A976FIH1_BRELC|nr:hypothetical protein CCR75_008632 [Bremia lactucae]
MMSVESPKASWDHAATQVVCQVPFLLGRSSTKVWIRPARRPPAQLLTMVKQFSYPDATMLGAQTYSLNAAEGIP